MPERKLEIPPAIYSRILEANYAKQASNRLLVTCQLALRAAIGQLDPTRSGLSIIIFKCTTPAPDMKVRSLFHLFSLGTPPWKTVIEQQNIFVGADFLAGIAVQKADALVIQDLHTSELTPTLSLYGRDGAHSAAVVLLQMERGVGGCLLIRSTYTGFFTHERLMIIQEYTRLIALSLEEREFYAASSIDLQPLQRLEEQQEVPTRFRRHLAALVRQERYLRNIPEAEQEARRRLEVELLTHPIS